jgi:hypothetical protein
MAEQEFSQSVKPPPRRSRQDSSTILLTNSPQHKTEGVKKVPQKHFFYVKKIAFNIYRDLPHNHQNRKEQAYGGTQYFKLAGT